MPEGEGTMSFRDLAVKAYENEDRDREKQMRKKLLRSFFETFGVKPESVDMEQRHMVIGPYIFRQDVTYEGKEWVLVIHCLGCHTITDCGHVMSLVDVGRKIVAWERDHKCNVTTTGEG